MNAAFLRKCEEKGLSLADAIELVEMMETGWTKPARSANAERQARFRARQAESVTNNVTSNASRVTEKVSPKPPSKNPPLVPLKGDISPQNFDAAWRAYPEAGRRRSSTKKSSPQWARASKAAGAERLLAAVQRYAESDDARADGGKYVPAFDRWLRDGKWEHWLEAEPTPPGPDDDPWPDRLRTFERNAYWNTTDWGPKPGKPGCLVPAEHLQPQGAAA